MLEGNLREDKDPRPRVDGVVCISYDRKKYQKDMFEDNIKDKGEVCTLRWEVYKKYIRNILLRDVFKCRLHIQKGIRISLLEWMIILLGRRRRISKF